MGKSIWPDSEHKTEVCVAALGNIAGNLATNVAYTLVSSSAAQVIKGCEPLFTFVLLLVLYRKYETLDLTTLFSVVTMVAGACTFVILDTTFNVWGLTAAIASNIAFPVRNIYLKRLQNTGTWENPLETYAIVSLFGVFLLLPVLFLKFVITQELFIIRLEGGTISVVSHFTYNVAFIAVLQSVSPLTHATLNLAKGVVVIMASIVYFHTPVSFNMSIGLLVSFFGLFPVLCNSKCSLKVSLCSEVFICLSLHNCMCHSNLASKFIPTAPPKSFFVFKTKDLYFMGV